MLGAGNKKISNGVNGKFAVTISPHIKSTDSVKSIMRIVALALAPAAAASVIIFGIRPAYIILASVLAAVLTEFVIKGLRRKQLTVLDGSALITGILLAFNLPPSVPLWIPVAGSIFAIAIGKEAFGGLGQNIFNPALIGRAFLLASWPAHMTHWVRPTPFQLRGVDAVTTASPLGIAKEKLSVELPTYWQLFIGDRAGCLGEVCIIALLLGAALLIYKKIITLHIPLAFIITVALFSNVFMGDKAPFTGDMLFYVLSGGLVLGAFFMATDYTTSPMTKKGKIIFGIGCGILTFLIRKYGGYPEGVSYSILIMNAAVPLIDRHTKTVIFGSKK